MKSEIKDEKQKRRASIKFAADSAHISIETSNHIDNLNINSKGKNVNWDIQSIEEQELEKRNNPRKKIEEPKTPYLPYDETGEDEEAEIHYLKKLNEINKIQPKDALFDEVCKRLIQEEEESNEELMQVEVIDGDGNVTFEKKNISDEIKNAEFKNKRDKAYKNEFLMAKRMNDEANDEEEDRETVMKETLKNTLYNKFYGKLLVKKD